MFATANSKLVFHNVSLGLTATVGVMLILMAAVGANATNTGNSRLVAHAQKVYVAAKLNFAAGKTNEAAAWQFARAAFDRAEFATNDSERATLAEQGIAACRGALERNPKSAPAHYYLGMNLGQLARTKSLGALKIVNEIEREFQAARALDERLDFAGPDRNLGLLYRDAPSIGSVGSKSKAQRHLLRAAVLVPDYPGNRLSLAESALKWRDGKTVQRELAALDELWPVAQRKLAGDDWEASWVEWSVRRDQLRTKARALSKPLASPRGAN